MTEPTLGSGYIPDGTYHCLIVEISDKVTIMPSKDSGPCKLGQPVVTDICSSKQGVPIRLTDGSASKCADGEQRVAVYLGAASVAPLMAPGIDTFVQPTSKNDKARGLKLDKPLVVSGSAGGAFGVDAYGRVNDDTGVCF